jgi:hypothetical protein
MQEQVIKFLTDIRRDSAKISAFDEVATKQALILRLFQLLGWNTFDTDEVRPEYILEGKRVDYSLAIDNRNEVFVEVKRPSQELERHEKQLLDYSFHLGVEIAVLTNGLIYWFYLPMTKGAWTERKFYTIDILQQDPHEVASKFADILAKENVSSGYSVKEGRRIYDSRLKNSTILETLPEAWNKIVGEPDGLIVDLLSQTTERLCGYKPEDKSVKEFLSDHVAQLRVSNISVEPAPIEPQSPAKSGTGIAIRLPRGENKVEIQLGTIHTPKTYALIPVPKEGRSFFPGYKVPFILETDIGQVETRVTSAPQGTQIGNPDAGNYIQGGLVEWYKRHHSLSNGSVLVIEAIERGKRYRLTIKDNQ